MYIRRVTRKNKDGSKVAYLQLAHNEWDPVKKYSRAKVVYSFGREDQLDKAVLERLGDSINRYLNPEKAFEAKAQIEQASDFVFESSQTFGGAYALDQLWRQLGIDRVIKKLLTERNFSIDVERHLFAMVANRALDPSSKLGVANWVENKAHVPGIEEVNHHNLYRTMDFLLEAQEAVEKEVFNSVANLLNLEVDLIFFDTTTTYFEVEKHELNELSEEELRTLGHSKDKRSDLPQVKVGLAATRDGIPIKSWLWPGNRTDMSLIKEVKKDLRGWKLGRVITVLDRGFDSEYNKKELQRAGGHYIMGSRMRDGSEDVKKAMSKKGRFSKVNEKLEVKEIIVGNGEGRRRYVLAYNPKQAEYEKNKREEIVKQAEERLKEIKQLPKQKHTKAMCELRSHKVYGKYIRQLKDGRLKIDRTKIREEAHYDGKYLIQTSDDTISPEDVALGYKQLLDIEEAFRTLKTGLKIRPIYHRLEKRIRGHILICWLALLLVRLAERETDKTWNRIRDSLENIHVGRFFSNSGEFKMRTRVTKEQAGILAAMGIEEPPTFVDIEPKS